MLAKVKKKDPHDADPFGVLRKMQSYKRINSASSYEHS
jgi:hypothetical protein